MESTNDYVIEPINDNIVQPINDNIVQPISKIITTSKPIKFVRFNEIVKQTFIYSTDTSDTSDEIDIDIDEIKVIEININDKSKRELSDEEFGCIKSYHLKKNNQTYFEHFKDSISYSGKSFKASLYFLVHAFIPDLFQYTGSAIIYDLHDTIQTKYNESLTEIITDTDTNTEV